MNHQLTPPKTNILFRVLMIRDSSQGSGFLIEEKGYQYLITANHLLKDSESNLQFFWKNNWHTFPCKVIGKDVCLDLAILKPDFNFVPKGLPIQVSMGNLLWGQQSFFLGYPSGNSGSFSIMNLDGRAMPYIKWAGISMLNEDASGEVVLDGHNNLGFSGGPACFTDKFGEQKILGMIKGYREEMGFVEHFVDEEFKEQLIYKQNAGLISVTSARNIVGLIEASGNGLPVGNNP